jgi:transcription antitermination factor NusG
MTRNWYALNTSPMMGKKVSAILTKRGIFNYFPTNDRLSSNAIKKISREPLFTSCVFVYITESEIESIKNIPGIVNFLYWKSKPAIIRQEEMEAVKEFTSSYQNIRLEKSSVNMNETVRIIEEPEITYKEKSASVKFHFCKVELPSLGYTMIAERGEPILSQELNKTPSVPQRFNAFFSNLNRTFFSL